jgi:putative flavoprotein involved in K+ transport
METYDVAVVGAGQAGLATGYYLKQKNLSFVLFDGNNRIGDSWRKRYESLVLFTNRKYSSLPGLKMSGYQEVYPGKDEMADYLECLRTILIYQ